MLALQEPDDEKRSSLLRVLLLVLLGVVACSSDDTHLPALLADPMADYEAEGVDLVDAWEQKERENFFMDKPVHAKVERTYRIADQSERDQVLTDAAAFAEAEGWRIQRESAHEYLGAKELAAGAGRIHLSTPAEDVLHDPGGPRVLRIVLDFGPVRLDDSTTTAPGRG